MPTSSVVLLDDNVHPYTAAYTPALLEHFNWELFDHPPNYPVLTTSDCHLFTHLKDSLGSPHFSNNEELMEGVKMCPRSQAPDFCDTGIQKLFPRYKCFSSGSDYVKK
jgi:hypothetical protein